MPPQFFMTARDDPRTLPEQRLAVVEKALSGPPTGLSGTYVYANVNYMLAGAIIERTTGQAWERVMQAELFDPLGLTSAGFGAPGHNVEGGDNVWGHRGAGWLRTAMRPDDPLSDNPPALGPAGTAHMTLADYARWLQVFLRQGDDWITPHTITQLTDTGGAEAVPYALGWMVAPERSWSKGPVLTHDGSNTLWYATAVAAPTLGAAFIGLTNQGDGAAATADAGFGPRIRDALNISRPSAFASGAVSGL